MNIVCGLRYNAVPEEGFGDISNIINDHITIGIISKLSYAKGKITFGNKSRPESKFRFRGDIMHYLQHGTSFVGTLAKYCIRIVLQHIYGRRIDSIARQIVV